MGHLSEDTSVRTGDSLDRAIRTVDVPFFIHADISLRIAVLCRHLAIFKQTFDPFLAGYEAALAVRRRICIDAAEFCSRKPWGLVRQDW